MGAAGKPGFWRRRTSTSLRRPTPRWPTRTPPTVPGSDREIPMHCHDCRTGVQAWWWTCRACGAVADPACAGRVGLVTTAIDSGLVSLVVRVLRPALTSAWIELRSHQPWPSSVEPVQEWLRELSPPHGRDPDVIDVDPADDWQVQAFAALLPHVIHAEAFRENTQLLSVGDTGGYLWCALDQAERSALARAMDAEGRTFEDVFQLASGRPTNF